MTATQTIEPALFDYRTLPEKNRAFVKTRAMKIRQAAKRTAHGIVRTGQWLTEVKERLEHGEWLPWLRSEFGWSARTAQNLMQVYDAFKNETVSHLEIDVRTLYMLAAPKTPEPVRQEVIHRAENGEKITHAKAVELLESYEARQELPTPAVARQIALATGHPTAASNNELVLPVTQEEEKALADEQDRIRNLYDAMGTIAKTAVTPEEMVRLGQKHQCRSLATWSRDAAKWLTAVAEEAKQ